MLSLSPRLIGGFALFLAVAAFVAMAISWRSERNRLLEWQGGVVEATREAAVNPKLGKDGVAKQIRLLGDSIRDMKAAIGRQNEAVNALAARTAAQQAESARAVLKAAERAEAALATSERLNASARAGGRVCEPSAALTEAWR